MQVKFKRTGYGGFKVVKGDEVMGWVERSVDHPGQWTYQGMYFGTAREAKAFAAACEEPMETDQ